MGVAVQASEPKFAVRYAITDEDVAATKERYALLVADTPAGYKEVASAIGECRTLRGEIEKRRVDLKADALAWGRKVDSEAKRLTGLLLEIEEPLKVKKLTVDQEKERIKREKEQAALRAFNEKARIEREAEEAKRKAERQAKEAERLAAQLAEEARLKAENDRLAKERAAFAEERRKADEERKAELAKADEARRKLAEERRILDEEKAKAQRIEEERLAKVRAEKEAAEKIERERAEEERKAKRLEELKPDIEKVAAFAKKLRAIRAPIVQSPGADVLIGAAMDTIAEIAARLDGFCE